MTIEFFLFELVLVTLFLWATKVVALDVEGKTYLWFILSTTLSIIFGASIVICMLIQSAART